MGGNGRPLTAAQSARFAAAHAALRAARMDEAAAIAAALVHEARDSADAQQLLGMVRADAGDDAGAEAAFHAALALAPDSEVVRLNLAGFLRRRGRVREALALLAQAAASARVSTQRGLLALDLGEWERARAEFAAAVDTAPGTTVAWHGLGNALRELGDLDASETALRRVVALAPAEPRGWFALGVLLRLRGDADDALSALRRAQAAGDGSPALADAINGVLHDLGDVEEAVAGARRLVASHPLHAPGQETLVDLLWEGGPGTVPGEDPMGAIAAAAALHPDAIPLQLGYVRKLLAAGRAAQALPVVEALRARAAGHPMVHWFAAEAWDALGERGRASTEWSQAARLLGDDAGFLNGRARHAFRAGEPELAERCAARVVEVDPRNAEGWSHLGTAWRLRGDPREHWLLDYDRLVGHVEVAPPAGYADTTAFLEALDATLTDLHHGTRAPLDQSVRGGSQTTGRLFGRPEPAIRAAGSALRAAVRQWLSSLPDDPAHPFLARKAVDVRMVGSWSVRLRSSGRHVNHIHNEGWASSAFHVSLPPSVRDADDGTHAGWLQFGQPSEALGLDLPPRRLLRPVAGKLALFPSCFWHGTLPFDDAEPRLTVAFDMQPA